MPCTFGQGLLYILWSCDHHTCTGSDIMMSRQDTDVTSYTTLSPTHHKVHQQLTKVLVVENTRNHAGTCPGDARCHTPHLFGSALTTGAFNRFIKPPFIQTKQVLKYIKIDLSCVQASWNVPALA